MQEKWHRRGFALEARGLRGAGVAVSGAWCGILASVTNEQENNAYGDIGSPAWVPMGRRRFACGLVPAFLAGSLAIAVLASAAWSLEASQHLLVFFVLPDWWLIFCGHLISGVAAVAGLALLVPPFIERKSRTWLRRLTSVLVALAAAAGAWPWLLYFVGTGLNAISASYTTVTAESGESVIVQHSGFDTADYVVYGQRSPFLYQRNAEGKSISDYVDTDDCTLAVRDSDHLLTCRSDIVPIPPLGE